MFIIESTDQATSARAGMLRTAHGVIPTPVFMPVGTGATVKGVFHRDLKNEIDAPVILANTYHL
ncbi:MAG: tRNA-guanine transglycosylase, partial [Bacteroidales bacterium]|nr:tRNA-guanine transglycosylase [Bacteroidales bacterium]